MEFMRSILNYTLCIAIACGFLSMLFWMFHILKGQSIVRNAAQKKFHTKYGASLPLFLILTKQEIELHLDKGSLEHKLATTQATAYERFIKSWIFVAACMIVLIASSYVFQWISG